MGKKLRSELRENARRVLAALDRRWVSAASAEVCTHLRRLLDRELGSQIKHILAWTAYFPGEIDLSPLLSAELGHRAIYLPRILPTRMMSFISIDTDWTAAFEPGWKGLPQPAENSGILYSTDWASQTLVLAPGLAFDQKGGRLGRGGGYYDRFLAQPAMHAAAVVGVTWSLQLVPHVPLEDHDIPMDWICHERGYFAAGSLAESNSQEELV